MFVVLHDLLRLWRLLAFGGTLAVVLRTVVGMRVVVLRTVVVTVRVIGFVGVVIAVMDVVVVTKMPRRARRRRKRKRFNINAWRAGQLNWNGEKPIIPNQLTRSFRTIGRLQAEGVDAAASPNYVNFHYFPINNFNDPMGAHHLNHGFFISEDDTDDHNVEHDNLIALDFKRVRVLSAKVTLRVDVNSVSSEDWVVAWRFAAGTVATASVPQFAAANNEFDGFAKAIVLWREIRNNPGWDYTIFSGTQSGGSMYPTSGTIVINIPRMMDLGVRLNRGYFTGVSPSARGLTEVEDYEHELSDVSHTSNFPKASVHLLLHVFKVRGELIVDNDVIIECTIEQKIRAYRDMELKLDDVPDEHPAL